MHSMADGQSTPVRPFAPVIGVRVALAGRRGAKRTEEPLVSTAVQTNAEAHEMAVSAALGSIFERNAVVSVAGSNVPATPA
jgi:hypothetical protein